MPHIHLEYSDNLKHLEIKPILLKMNQALIAAAYVNHPDDLKSRAVMQQDYVIGLNLETTQAYLHAKVSLLSGRSAELRKQISDTVLKVMLQEVPKQQDLTVQFCVEILEMSKETYGKAIIA